MQLLGVKKLIPVPTFLLVGLDVQEVGCTKKSTSRVFRVEQGLDTATGTSIKKKTTKHFSTSLYSAIPWIDRGVQVGLTMKITSLMQGRAIEPCILFICMSVLP